MPPILDIDFNQIRPFDGDRRKGFEQFICQIARRHPPEGVGEFRRVEGAGGDGGLEAYWKGNADNEHGFQAKYFLATKDIDWAQVDKSIKAALTQHPSLKSYVVAFACDLTDRAGKLGRGKTGWQHWDTHKARWKQWAAAKGMEVEFTPWTKFDIAHDLISNPDHRGLILFLFGKETFSRERFKALFERTRADLGERFHPEDNVRVHLIEAFEGLRRSPAFKDGLITWFEKFPGAKGVLQSADDLTTKPDPALLNDLNAACDAVRKIADEIRALEFGPFPIARWGEAFDEVWRSYSALNGFFRDLELGLTPDKDGEITKIRHAADTLHEIGGYADTAVPIHRHIHNQRPPVAADLKRVVLVVGEPGVGKSHLFADATEKALSEAAPAILMLGQQLQGDSLRNAFIEYLGVTGQEFEVALQALDAAGELANQRAMILIDALNEAPNLGIWSAGLGGFVREILKFPHLAIGLSLRPEYADILLPPFVKSSAEELEYRGIRSADEQEQAAIQYFEKRGITRPNVPWLAPEFSNFLFLRTVCNAISLSESKEFPRGLRGALDILLFYLRSIDQKIRVESPTASIPQDAVVVAVRNVAAWMAERRSDAIDSASAIPLCQTAFYTFGPVPGRSWFAVLVSEGVFRRDHIISPDTDPFSAVLEVYRFSYQRFSDHLIARALLDSVPDIHKAFVPDGVLAFLLKDRKWSSLWQALAVQIPERFPGTEVLDVVPDSAESRVTGAVESAFRQSLLWRAPSAFSDQTIKRFNDLDDGYGEGRLSVLLRLATVSGHPWNADFLNENLLEWPLPKRDKDWTTRINRASDRYGPPVWEIIQWTLRAPLDTAEDETVRLVALTLCWFLTASNREIRDTATKALIRAFVSRPSLGKALLRNFRKVDDLYVMERLCAAIYGAAARSTDRQVVGGHAAAIYDAIFDREDVPPDILIRDYARGTIDYAVARDCLPARVDKQKCVPPYKSAWPLQFPTKKEMETVAETAGGNQIRYSAAGLGDFARYEIETSLRHFSRVPLSEPRPLNAAEKFQRFWETLSTQNDDIRARFRALVNANKALQATFKMKQRDDEHGLAFIGEYDPQALISEQAAREDFLGLLSDEQRKLFDELAVPALYPTSVDQEDRSLKTFDSEAAKRWIVVRAYGFGWTKDLFPNDSSSESNRDNRARVERIGKKYQWLAHSELLARLSDNVWTLDNFPDRAEVYDTPTDNWFVRDIEPSVLTETREVQITNCWWQKGAFELGSVEQGSIGEWPFSGVAPSGPEWIDVISPDGTKWLLLHTLWSSRDEREDRKGFTIPTVRDAFVRVSSILVEAAEVDNVFAKLKGESLGDPSGHETIDWTDGPFLLEYPWRRPWTTGTPFEPDPWRSFSGLKYIRPVARQVWESHLDASLKDGLSVCLPHPWIGEKLGVRPDLREIGSCIQESNGKKIFADPAFGFDSVSSALIDPDVFRDFLAKSGLDCIWIVAGERNAYPSGMHGDYSCRLFCGIHRWAGGKWVSETWHYDTLGEAEQHRQGI